MKNVYMLLTLLMFFPLPGKSQEAKNQYVFSTSNLTRYQFPTHINDLVMDRSAAQFSEVFIVVIEPEKGPPVHKHNDTEQIFFMLEGEGTLLIGKESDVKMVVVPGDVIRIPVDSWHTIKADKGKQIKYLAIDCFGTIRNHSEPTWDSHVKVLCKEQGWDYEKVIWMKSLDMEKKNR